MFAVTYNWDGLANAIRVERARRKWSQLDLANRAGAGVSQGTVKNLEGSHSYKKPPLGPLQAIDRAFEWEVGTLEGILISRITPPMVDETSTEDGSAPQQAEDPFAQLRDRLPLRATHALENGRIFDTLTYDLTPDGGARVISVVMVDQGADADMTPDVRARIGRAWEITQRRILGLPPLAWEPGDPEEDKPPPKS